MPTLEELARANALRTAPVDTTLTDRATASNARVRAALTGPVDTTLTQRVAANQPRITAPVASVATPAATPPQVITNPVNPNVQRGVPSIEAQQFNAARAPVAPAAAPEAGAIRRVASQAGGILRGIPSAIGKAALPVAAGIEAIGIANTPTEQYAQRLGATAGESLGQDLAVRAAGGMADFGNTLTLGVADRVGNAIAGNGFTRSPQAAAPVLAAAPPATIAQVAQTAAGAPVKTARAAPTNVALGAPRTIAQAAQPAAAALGAPGVDQQQAVHVIRGMDQSMALPNPTASAASGYMREVPLDIYSAGQGAIAKFQQAQADNAVNVANPVGAKTIQELAVQQAQNAGTANVAGIHAGASKYGADKSSEAATKNLMVIPGEEYLAPDGFTKLKKPSVLFDAATRQAVDLGQAGAPKPAIAEGSISTVNGKQAKFIGGKWVPL